MSAADIHSLRNRKTTRAPSCTACRSVELPANASTTVDLKLPNYQIVNLNGGVDFDNGLSVIVYVNNLFNENALLGFDRERGGRARLGFNVNTPRTYGLTMRKTF